MLVTGTIMQARLRNIRSNH